MNKLRVLLDTMPFVRAIEAVSGLQAMIADSALAGGAEFSALWLSGFTHAANRALRDDGTMPLSDKLYALSDITRVSDKPVIIDCDTGGSPKELQDTAFAYENAGAAAIVVEDKCGEKKNSLYCDKTLHKMETPERFCEKIAAAKSCAFELMIFARIESFIAGENEERALSRAAKYIAAGADGIVIHSTDTSGQEVLCFSQKFKADFPHIPLGVIPTMYPTVSCETLHGHGANIIIYANQMTRSAFLAMRKAAEMILSDGCASRADKYAESAVSVLEFLEGGKQ